LLATATATTSSGHHRLGQPGLTYAFFNKRDEAGIKLKQKW